MLRMRGRVIVGVYEAEWSFIVGGRETSAVYMPYASGDKRRGERERERERQKIGSSDIYS